MGGFRAFFGSNLHLHKGNFFFKRSFHFVSQKLMKRLFCVFGSVSSRTINPNFGKCYIYPGKRFFSKHCKQTLSLCVNNFVLWKSHVTKHNLVTKKVIFDPIFYWQFQLGSLMNLEFMWNSCKSCISSNQLDCVPKTCNLCEAWFFEARWHIIKLDSLLDFSGN